MASGASPSTSAADETQNAPLGIGMMVAGFFLFAVNDTFVKWMAETYPPGQIMLFRNIASVAILLPFLWRAGFASLFRMDRPWLHAMRLVFATAEVLCFYLAVSGLGLADIMTYYLAGPIYVTVLAAVFLKEQVGWRRWSAVAVGFVGVLVALKPSTGMLSYHALVALAGSVFYAFFITATRRVHGTSGLSMAAWQVIVGLVTGAVLSPFQWVPFGGAVDAGVFFFLGLASLGAIVCVNYALKLAPASVVVPYQYTVIIWAVIFGFFVFGDVPSWRVLAGAAIIICAGLYIFFREQRVARASAAAAN